MAGADMLVCDASVSCQGGWATTSEVEYLSSGFSPRVVLLYIYRPPALLGGSGAMCRAGRPVPEAQLLSQLQAIHGMPAASDAVHVGSLTALPRAEWAAARAELEKNPVGAAVVVIDGRCKLGRRLAELLAAYGWWWRLQLLRVRTPVLPAIMPAFWFDPERLFYSLCFFGFAMGSRLDRDIRRSNRLTGCPAGRPMFGLILRDV